MLTLDQIRQELPAVQRAVYLNTGSNGPLPRAAAVAMAEAAARELNEGRIVPTAWQVFSETKIRLREDFAALLHAPPTSVALTHSTTEGVNLALWGLNWQAGYIIRTVPHPPFGLRASTGFFNTTAELLGLATEIGAWLARGPAAVKAPPMAVGLPAQYVKPG